MGRPLTSIKLPYVHSYRDRHGRRRYYVRRRGAARVAIPGQPGSPKFMAAYNAAVSGVAPAATQPAQTKRTLSALFASYRASGAFKNLKGQSPKTYRYVMDLIAKKDGHRGVDIPDDKARKLIEEIAEQSPSMANLTRSVMRQVFRHSIRIKWRTSNPFGDIEAYDGGTHHTWTEAQIAAYERRWAIGTRERMAFDLLYYTAQRVGDVANMRRSDILNGKIYVVQQKTGVELRIPIHPALQRSMNAYGIRGLYLFGSKSGKKKLSGKGVSDVVRIAARAASLPEECVPHGIRKAIMRDLANLNINARGIGSLSGHKTLKEIERYTEAVNQERLAEFAIASLPDRAASG